MSDLDLKEIAARYSKALDAKPGKGDISPDGIAALTDSVCDVPQLLAEVERLTRWKSEAWPVMEGMQDLGAALGLRLGEFITGPAAVDAVVKLRARADAAEAALRDFAEHGTRHDLTPTIPSGEQGPMHLLRYIDHMDAAVRNRARRALDGDTHE